MSRLRVLVGLVCHGAAYSQHPGGIWGPAAPPGSAVLLRLMETMGPSRRVCLASCLSCISPGPGISHHRVSRYGEHPTPAAWGVEEPLCARLMILPGFTMLVHPVLPTTPLPGRSLMSFSYWVQLVPCPGASCKGAKEQKESRGPTR